MPPRQDKLKLPKALVDQLGGEGALSNGRKPRAGGGKVRTHAGSRKELRKAARGEKRQSRNGPPPAKRQRIESNTNSPAFQQNLLGRRPLLQKAAQDELSEDEEDNESVELPKPKSILKRTKKADSESKPSERQRSASPLPKIKKKANDNLDDEIAWLEYQFRQGKKGVEDDGLDELLEGLGEESEDEEAAEKKSRKAEGDEWLDRKRREARNKAGIHEKQIHLEDADEDGGLNDETFGDDVSDDDGASDMSLDGPQFPDDDSGEEDVGLGDDGDVFGEDDDFSDFSSEGDEEIEAPRIRENPYIAPTTNVTPTGKYIPPSLRKAAASESEEMIRLRRRTQGLVNRLTEANLIALLGDFEKSYRENPRQHVTSILIDVVLTSVCESASLSDTFIILHAGFTAALYKIIGTDFGAQFVQKTVELFDEHYIRAKEASQATKETSNLLMLLSELYNFQVVGSNLIFDYVRLLLSKLSELNAELLLKVIRTSGPQLRQDDPSSLKNIVVMLHQAVAAVGKDTLTVRTKFMIETIDDLKNNKLKTGAVASAVTSEHTIRMKKIIGSLNTRSLKASEPLRIGMKDIQESDKKGKWWLVGASWSGSTPEEATNDSAALSSNNQKAMVEDDDGTSNLTILAQEQRMNTDIRRAIFITIMSATDYEDAYLRLMKLKLKKVQEYEIPKVLIKCAGSEKSYNPYYTLIAKKVCGDRRLKTAFQFCLWDLFKKTGESDDDDQEHEDGDEDSLDTRTIVNLAKMFGTLIVEGGLGLNVLKTLNLSYLQTKTKTFIEILFITLILHSQKSCGKAVRDKQAIINIFTKSRDAPEMIRGLQYFLKKVVSKTDIAGGRDEKATVRWACKVAGGVLQDLSIESKKD